ncbi:hypothetical protein SNE35_09710 [Paucibacter sp. R3-3]|uniref:Uncharacterized protein n=1 Tax=Roseateles agri TaxID=3098619 RepID=A0ABU5DER9_9BURK|nr:hypothetical protein [Paucibacter sp. R3-3]MDY0744784.1 hypothetical protein [Paucibacter sp. R3-3]
MTVALGVVTTADGMRIVAADAGEKRVELPLTAIVQQGLPKKRSRLAYKGQLDGWASADFNTYCRGLSLVLPDWAEPKHQLFTHMLEDGTTVYVPALAFMRAFFWPSNEVLPATFSSQNIDQFAHIAYQDEVPMVVVQGGPYALKSLRPDEGNDRYLKWLLASASARRAAQSVELAALKGWLGIRLPEGEFDLSIVGHRTAEAFYATSIEVNCVKVGAADNISEQEELFYLHRSPVGEVERRASRVGPTVSDAEWCALEPWLRAEGFLGGHAGLILMLRRMVNGYWDIAAPGIVSEAGRVLRTWSNGATLQGLLDRLDVMRRGVFPMTDGRLQALSSDAMDKRSHPGAASRSAQVFLDTEFVDRNKEVVFLSIGLDSAQGQFYGERVPGSLGAGFSAGQFIDEEVLPQLGLGVGMQGAICDIASALVDWLNGLDADRVEVHYDFNIDYSLFENLLALVPGRLRVELQPSHIGYLLEDPTGITAAFMAWTMAGASKGLRRHHALADAMALRARFNAVHPDQSNEEDEV